MFYVLFHYSKGNKERDFRGFRSEDDLIDFLHLEHERIEIVQIISVEKSYRLGLVETEELAKSALFEKVIIGQRAGIDISEKDIEESKEILKQTLETDLPSQSDGNAGPSSKKHPYLRNKPEEKSAMEKIGDDIEKEQEEDKDEIHQQHEKASDGPIVEEALTGAEIIAQNKETLEKLRKAPPIEETLERGKRAIAAAEKDLAKKPDSLIIKPVAKPAKRHYTQNDDRKKDWPTCPECKKNPMAPWNTSGRCSECQQYKKIPKKK